jgi:hypothetical protein
VAPLVEEAQVGATNRLRPSCPCPASHLSAKSATGVREQRAPDRTPLIGQPALFQGVMSVVIRLTHGEREGVAAK